MTLKMETVRSTETPPEDGDNTFNQNAIIYSTTHKINTNISTAVEI
jgi:hypothetical protein